MSSNVQVGDFVENKLHGYITYLFKQHTDNVDFFDGLIVDVNMLKNQEIVSSYIRTEYIRIEVAGELKKITPTKILVSTTKECLIKLNSFPNQQIDNLTYVELLSKLNAQEKDLANENKL
jgi:hypothetical protein